MGMTFEELGNILRTEREKLGLNIDDVAHRLKISARVLRALENADNDSLPHSVYVRGFVISYARLLELDTEELLTVEDLYDASEDPSNSELHLIETRPTFNKSKIIFLLFICLCLAGGGFVWLNRDADLFSKIKKDHLTTAQPAPPVASPLETEAPKDASSAQNSPQEQAGQNVQNPAEQSTSQDNVQENSNVEVETQDSQTPEQSTTETEQSSTESITENTTEELTQLAAALPEAVPALDGPNRVIITAIAECWVHSNADDADTRQFSLRSGDTFALTFSESLTLKLGNAGGVRIRYNGAETPIPGRDGEVKTLTFPPEQ